MCLSLLVLLITMRASLSHKCGRIFSSELYTKTHTIVCYYLHNQYKKDEKLETKQIFDTCFSHFYPIYDSRNLLQGYYEFIMAVLLVHIACYRPERLFKDSQEIDFANDWIWRLTMNFNFICWSVVLLTLGIHFTSVCGRKKRYNKRI